MDKITIYTQPDEQQEKTNDVNESIKEKLETLIDKQPPPSSEFPLYESLKNKNLDFDGLEIPEGKIPLDGQFSTKEVQEIVKIAQDDGVLKEDITVKLIETKAVGDKVVISDPKETATDGN